MKNSNRTSIKTGDFDSKFEKSLYDRSSDKALLHNKRNGDGMYLVYTTMKKYFTDLVYLKSDCTPMYIEAKGYFKPSDRSKMLSVKECNPKADIRLVFQRDNWLTSKKLKKYSDWAERNGFPYAIGSIPPEWLVE